MENKTDILNELKALSTVVVGIEKRNVFTVPQGYFEYLAADIMTGIKTENGLGTAVVSTSDVPAGYFDSLSASILNKIRTQETENGTLPAELVSVAGKNVYEVPQGYFDTLSESIFIKIKTATAEDAATEIRALSPMLYSIQNENVFEAPAGYFEDLGDDVLTKIKPQTKVISISKRSSNILKYAVAAVFTGVMALGVYKFTNKSTDEFIVPDYVTAGLKVQDVDQELAKISDDEIVKFLEANGTDVKTAMVVGSTDNNELPAEEDYLLDEKALEKYLNTINIDGYKN